MKFIFGISLLFALTVCSRGDAEVELSGPNVCNRTEDYFVKAEVPETEKHQGRKTFWCWSHPLLRCSKYELKNRTVYKTEAFTKSRIVKECCAGYERNKTGDQCIPICTEYKDGVAPKVRRCDPGFRGPACDISLLCNETSTAGKHGQEHGEERKEEESNSIVVAWGVTVSLLLFGVIVFVFVLLYYRRRIRDLKTITTDVEFHTNPQSQPKHFDNQLYAFQISAINDTTQLLNKSRPSKPTNLEQYRPGTSDTASNASSRAGPHSVHSNTDTSPKNNLNLNPFIDENNKDHVYYEIEQNDGYEDPGVYGHLDFEKSTPFKPHYHRMNVALKIV